MKRLIKPLTVILLLFTCINLASLEVRDGKIKLILHEGIGRFSMYYLIEPEKQKYIPFFVDQDPRTSYITLAINNKVYRLGEDFMFKESAEKTGTGAKFSWTSELVNVTEEFVFTTSRNSLVTDGIKILLTITNVTEKDIEAGARFLIDTYLGESSYSHFFTDKINLIDKEVMVTSQENSQYCVSPYHGNQENVGLQIITRGMGGTVPNKEIFANWKRLNDTSWAYTVLNTRDFSVRPYSINDSAVALYYNPATIKPQGSHTITLIMGNYSPEGFKAADVKTDDEITKLLDDLTKKPDEDISSKNGQVNLSDSTYAKIKSDIITVQNLINEIDKKMKAGQKFSQNDLDLMKQILYELKERIKIYQSE